MSKDLYMFAGINGARKSTLLIIYRKNITFVNDEVAEWATEAIKVSRQKYR